VYALGVRHLTRESASSNWNECNRRRPGAGGSVKVGTAVAETRLPRLPRRALSVQGDSGASQENSACPKDTDR